MSDFKECLKQLRDGNPSDALLAARRALGIAPKNPFYLSYTGLLAAISEKRFADGEALCQEALGMRHNHAQLYLNLAEVYQQCGRTQDAIETLEKGLVSAGASEDRHAARSDAVFPAPEPPCEPNARQMAPPFCWSVPGSLSGKGHRTWNLPREVIRGGPNRESARPGFPISPSARMPGEGFRRT
jgi:tetratricopeptide (TPR) repeat protein